MGQSLGIKIENIKIFKHPKHIIFMPPWDNGTPTGLRPVLFWASRFDSERGRFTFLKIKCSKNTLKNPAKPLKTLIFQNPF